VPQAGAGALAAGEDALAPALAAAGELLGAGCAPCADAPLAASISIMSAAARDLAARRAAKALGLARW
jgi:hypothetical protein